MMQNRPSRRQMLSISAGLLAAGLIAGHAEAMQRTSATTRGTGTGLTSALVFGHRGCPALRPEHTLASYAKAIADGADFIEPDLVATRDGVLISRHEINIAETTDVAGKPEFAGRRTTRLVDGVRQTGWFTEDFTLHEIKSLRARERLGTSRPVSQSFDDQFHVLTFAEIVEFAAAASATLGRQIGLIPEIKHSTHFHSAGIALEDLLLTHFAESAYLQTAPVIIQSFEVSNLKRLRRDLAGRSNVQLMQLIGDREDRPADLAGGNEAITYANMLKPEGLQQVAAYADYVAPNSREVIPLRPDGALGVPSELVTWAHGAGLRVAIWTMRPENRFLPADLRDSGGDDARNPAGSLAEIQAYLRAGVDSFFTDDPALGRQAVDTYIRRHSQSAS